jgi:hypothetical protein
MTDTTHIGFPEAARRLGVPLRVLRQAIRTGRVPAPAERTATATLTADWLASVQAAAGASPAVFSRAFAQKVPAFARYAGTSAWTGDRKRVHSYRWFRAAAERAAAGA